MRDMEEDAAAFSLSDSESCDHSVRSRARARARTHSAPHSGQPHDAAQLSCRALCHRGELAQGGVPTATTSHRAAHVRRERERA